MSDPKSDDRYVIVLHRPDGPLWVDNSPAVYGEEPTFFGSMQAACDVAREDYRLTHRQRFVVKMQVVATYGAKPRRTSDGK